MRTFLLIAAVAFLALGQASNNIGFLSVRYLNTKCVGQLVGILPWFGKCYVMCRMMGVPTTARTAGTTPRSARSPSASCWGTALRRSPR